VSGIAPTEISSPAFAASSAPATPGPYDLGAIVALALAVCMFHLGSFGLWEPDEARYAEIAREMLQSGNLLVPHLNYVAYVEKPPLLYWLTTLSFRIFGVSEFAARLPVALSAIAGILATYFFALRAFGRRHALLAAAVLTTTPLYALMAQVLTTDMTLTALITIATFSLYLHWLEGGRWCWLAYVAMGLAVMTKGPVGAALPILSILIWLALKRELAGAIAKFRAVPGIILMILIAAPWFIAMTIREPGFANFYFVGEHIRRVFETDYSHSEAFYFYLPVLAIGLLPWSLLVPFLTWRAAAARNPARSFCLVAASVTVVAFSCASAKLIPYVLPAVPPLAVLIADGLVSLAWPAAESRAALRVPDSRILLESGPMLALLGAGVIVAALEAAQQGGFDLIVLDVMLPGLDGFEILKRLRVTSRVPVLMLTARGEDVDRIIGLELGADDYLPKPFNPRELTARVRAILRRTENKINRGRVEINGVALDPGTREVTSDGKPIEVTTLEFDILEQLMRNAGRVVSRDGLMESLYNRKATPFDRSIDMHVSHLRRKLESSRPVIKTIRGVGYQFCQSPEDVVIG